MDSIDIETAFLEIQTLHTSFDEDNPVTYQILLTEYGDKLTEDQKKFIKEIQAQKIEKKRAIERKIMEYIDNEVSRAPLLSKINESENKIIKLENN
jgi:putative heme iron utilization protein